MPIGAWLTLEYRSDGSAELRTADLNGVVRVLSLDVVAAFCACFIHADRLQSLFSMYEELVGDKQRLATRPGRKPKRRPPSIAESRDFLTFYAMAYGTLVELCLELSHLNVALIKKNLFLRDEWIPLKDWVSGASREAPSKWRNKFAFHVDSEWLQAGIKKIKRRSIRKTTSKKRPTMIFQGSSPKQRDTWFKLGHDALLAGIPKKWVASDFDKMMGVYWELQKFFVATLKHAGLGPVMVGVRRGG